MAAYYTYKVQLESNTGFILDSDVLDTGILGYLRSDVTSYVRSVSTRVGRSTIQDQFTAGQMTIVFDNRSRAFDPNYTGSPFYGSIKPRRDLIFTISTTNNPSGFPVFSGTIDSWSFEYDINGDSVATASVSDAFSVLAKQNINLVSPPVESTLERFNRVLNDSSVAWPVEARSVIYDAFTMGTASYSGNALAYLQSLADSERGYLATDGYGQLVLWGWNWFSWTRLDPDVAFGPTGGTAIPFTSIETSYDTDQFYNYVTVSGYPGTAVFQNTTSQADYGISAVDYPVLQSGTAQMAYVGNNLISKFSDPRFRVSRITASLDSSEVFSIFAGYGDGVTTLLATQIGAYAQITWTPNNVGTPVTYVGFIIGIDIQATMESCNISFSISADDTRVVYP